MRVERVYRLPAQSAVPAVIEVVMIESRPGRIRAWLAKLLVRIAGRIAGMRVRIVGG